MKKLLTIVLVSVMMFSLTACGDDKVEKSVADEVISSQSSQAEETSALQEASGEIVSAQDGEFVLSSKDIAVVVNGTAVPMPYNLVELEAAGVPVNADFREDELTSGSSFGLNLYLDENDDYILIPDYYNGGENTVILTEAEAKTITMVSYAEKPVDQGVSLLRVTFGMTKSDVRAMLGEPMYDNGDYFEWQVAVSDAGYEGSFFIYFTDDADDAGASQIDLTRIEA